MWARTPHRTHDGLMDLPDAGDLGAATRGLRESTALETGARIGFAANGILHLLVGWIALSVAAGHASTTADQSGALLTLSRQPLGGVLLWLVAAGFALLGLWYLTEAVTGGRGRDRTDRAKALAKLVLYAALAWTAYRFASGGGSSSRGQTRDVTATLLGAPGGVALVAVLGLVVVVVGGYHVVKGWRRGFLADLREHPGPVTVFAGQVGYVAKGLALVVVGVLFVVGALTHSTKDTTGLDGALRTLRAQPYGAVVLTAIALGIIAYGIYSFARARYAKV